MGNSHVSLLVLGENGDQRTPLTVKGNFSNCSSVKENQASPRSFLELLTFLGSKYVITLR